MKRIRAIAATAAVISLLTGGLAAATVPLPAETGSEAAGVEEELPEDTNNTQVAEENVADSVDEGAVEDNGEDNGENAGEAQVVDEVAPAAHPDLQVTQYAGPNRYWTNTWINQFRIVPNRPVFVATGSNFADALSVAPAVARTGGLLVLTPKNKMPYQVHDLVKLAYPSKIYIIGGKGAVSDSVVKQLDWIAPVERIAGADRYETSYLVLQKFFTGTSKTAFIATGADYPDALSAAAAAGAQGGPVILVNGKRWTTLPKVPLEHMMAHGTEKVVVVGGTGVVHQYLGDHIGDYFPVRRLGGADRYATNMLVNNYLNEPPLSLPLTELWIATGKNFPDALSAAGPAGHMQKRLVLSNGKCIPKPVVSTWIDGPGSQIKNVYLAGGTGVLSTSVKNLTQCP